MTTTNNNNGSNFANDFAKSFAKNVTSSFKIPTITMNMLTKPLVMILSLVCIIGGSVLFGLTWHALLGDGVLNSTISGMVAYTAITTAYNAYFLNKTFGIVKSELSSIAMLSVVLLAASVLPVYYTLAYFI